MKIHRFWNVSSLFWIQMWHLQWLSVGQHHDSKAISSHRAYLTYDTLWALPSKVVYSCRSAYILSMVGPKGNWSSYPDSAGADICSTHQPTEKIKSLTLAALVLGSTHWAPWEIEFVTLTVAALTALHKRAAKLQNFKGRVTLTFYLGSVEVTWVTKGKKYRCTVVIKNSK